MVPSVRCNTDQSSDSFAGLLDTKESTEFGTPSRAGGRNPEALAKLRFAFVTPRARFRENERPGPNFIEPTARPRNYNPCHDYWSRPLGGFRLFLLLLRYEAACS